MDKYGEIRTFAVNALLKILRPASDPRRKIETLDHAIIQARSKCNRYELKESDAIDISDFSDPQISLIYNDCTSHIRAHQQQHWKIFTWSVAVLAAMAGFAIAKPAILDSSLGIIGIESMMLFAGAASVYFMNEESVMLERNRNHLDAIRACMHPIVQDIYIDKDANNNHSNRRTSMKRVREIVMHAMICTLTIFLMIFLILFRTIDIVNSA